MEYTDYYVARETAQTVRERLEGVDAAMIVDMLDGFVPFATATYPADLGEWDWLMRVYDAEGSAWGFMLWIDGEEVSSGEWGENGEWGIEVADNGFEGDIEATARALGTDAAELEACWNADGVESFCELVGFPHQYTLYPYQIPDGVHFVSEL